MNEEIKIISAKEAKDVSELKGLNIHEVMKTIKLASGNGRNQTVFIGFSLPDNVRLELFNLGYHYAISTSPIGETVHVISW